MDNDSARLGTPDDTIMLDKFRTGKAYAVAQAAALARTTPATVRRWLRGYEAPGHRMAPVFGRIARGQEDSVVLVSFLELVEIVIVARFRQGSAGHPIKLERLRRAHEFAREILGLPYPFASLRLREEGGHIMHEFDQRNPGGPRLALDMRGQYALPIPVETELKHLDFERAPHDQDPFAMRWFPKGRAVPIVVDPRIAAGKPTVYHRGVTVETIYQRWRRGEPMESIAEDYELEPSAVENVLQFAA